MQPSRYTPGISGSVKVSAPQLSTRPKEWDTPASKMMVAMNMLGSQMYAGTVDPAEVVRRRKKNKVSRKSRAAARRIRKGK